jgi:hypothetical protein
MLGRPPPEWCGVTCGLLACDGRLLGGAPSPVCLLLEQSDFVTKLGPGTVMLMLMVMMMISTTNTFALGEGGPAN